MFVAILKYILWIAMVPSTVGSDVRELRTYGAYSYPVDPTRIATIADMDLSYATVSTLVQWSAGKQVSAGMAETWSVQDNGKTVVFVLRSDSRWSDGSRIAASDVLRSLDRAKNVYPADMRGYAALVGRIELLENQKIAFHLAKNASPVQLLRKLTELQTGIVRLKSDGKTVDMSITSGAYFAESATESEVVLRENANWFGYSPAMPRVIRMRTSKGRAMTPDIFLRDPWPNLALVNSVMTSSEKKLLMNSATSLWHPMPDKLYFLGLTKYGVESGASQRLLALRAKVTPEEVVGNLEGAVPARQFFPEGYPLFERQVPEMARRQTSLSAKLEIRTKSDYSVVIAKQRVFGELKSNFIGAMKKALGSEPEVREIELSDHNKVMNNSKSDFYFGSIGLADPDPEGALSYYIEGESPIIRSDDANNFVAMLDQARRQEAGGEQGRLRAMTQLLAAAVNRGHILPLFHATSLGIARGGVDLSPVPISDESVTFSKIRFK